MRFKTMMGSYENDSRHKIVVNGESDKYLEIKKHLDEQNVPTVFKKTLQRSP